MATVNGTAGNDFIHRSGDGLVAPPGFTNIVGATSGADVINGLGGNDILNGNSGDDTLDGGTGADVMRGGKDNDTYVVDNAGDVVDESVPGADGIDTILSSVNINLTRTDLYRGAIENVTLVGSASTNVIGNDLANILIGNDAGNILDGGNGADILRGLGGDDTYVVGNPNDVVDEGAAGSGGVDTVQSAVSFSLAQSATVRGDVENLTLIGHRAINAVGNDLANRLIGNGAANILDGGHGADVMIGLEGDDTYVIGNRFDVVDEGIHGSSGNDTVLSSITASLQASSVMFGDVENLTLVGSADLDGTGNALANRLVGNAGDNVLTGQGGNDVYVVQNAGDQVVEAADGGIDRVESSITNTLSANVENLTLTGLAAINGTGNGLANRLVGNAAVNILTGGAGDDVYEVQTVGDQAVEAAGGGIDRVESSIAYSLGANLEDLTLTGSAKINGNGNGLNNTLIGNGAANRLNGGLGADRMAGGGGGDTYVVENAGDVVDESIEGSGGVDLVESSISFSFADAAVAKGALENLTLTGGAGINATGNALANRLVGNSGSNILDGGAGADLLRGMGGNDTYVVDSLDDIINEGGSDGSGTDTVLSSVSFSLVQRTAVRGTLEHLTLIGSNAINGTGNALANRITGNEAANILAGGAGNDVYIVQNTDDQVIETEGGGVDRVESVASFTLGDWVENLKLVGGAGDIDGTGNAQDNVITGNNSNNRLTGGGGADTLIGLSGNDDYFLDSPDDVVQESFGDAGGLDTIYVGFSASLEQSATLIGRVENLTLTGSADINATGSTGSNRLTGNAGKNVLTGGSGNDTYVIHNEGDQIIEGRDGGTDTVEAFLSYTLGEYLEDLVLVGSEDIHGTGNNTSNRVYGNTGDNVLSGGLGAGLWVGDGVVDLLRGDDGADTFVFASGDHILDFSGTRGGDGDKIAFLSSLITKPISYIGSDQFDASDATVEIRYEQAGQYIAINAFGGSFTNFVIYVPGATAESFTLDDFIVI